MRIFIEIPSWLGDSLMVTPAIENLSNCFKGAELILMGSSTSVEVFKSHPQIKEVYIAEKNYFKLYKAIKEFGSFDFFFSFRDSPRSKFVKLIISSKEKFQFNKNLSKKKHQVEKYNSFINSSLNIDSIPGDLVLYKGKNKTTKKKKLLGINPGSSYGNAKRWYPEEFAKLAIDLSTKYDIIIFGGEKEKDIADDIEKYLVSNVVMNYQNLAAKTSINELIDIIGSLDLFITGDSGPMHVAAALKITTVSIFGPTNFNETSQWMNRNSKIVRKNLNCQPCMKRKCPLGHHDCMKKIKASDVLQAIQSID